MLDIILNETDSLIIKEEIVKIKNLSPQGFEDYVANVFKNLHFDVEQTPPTNDGGKDIILKHKGKTIYVECKHFSDGAVGREIIQKLVGATILDGASECYVATSSFFNLNAIKCSAKFPNIRLLDLYDIARLSVFANGNISSNHTETRTSRQRTPFEIYKDVFNLAISKFYAQSTSSPLWIKLNYTQYDSNSLKIVTIDNVDVALLTIKKLVGTYPIRYDKPHRIAIAYRHYVYTTINDCREIDINDIFSATEYNGIQELIHEIHKITTHK